MSYWSRSFPGLAECLSEVRQFTLMVLGDKPGSDLVVLAVSELAGNAIVHTASGEPGGQFVVHLAAYTDRWQVRVDDEGAPSDPQIVVDGFGEGAGAELDWAAEAGRGLAMVAAVSEKWGVLGDRNARAVWAQIPYPAPDDEKAESATSGDLLDALETVAEALAGDGLPDADCDPDADGGEGLEPGSEPEAAVLPATAIVVDGSEAIVEAPDTLEVCEGSEVPAEPLAPGDPGDSADSAEPQAPADPADPAQAPQGVPAPRWPGRVPTDPKLAERHRRAARNAVFARALLDHAYMEAMGGRPVPYWPPFPHPLARRRGEQHGRERESEQAG